ncbi:MAG: triose-phosphate isomerase [Magnetococcus sp. YQC-3]
MQRRPLVVGNWKMNGTLAFAQELAGAVCAGAAQRAAGGPLPCELILCPPFTALSTVRHCLEGSAIHLGGQNVAEQPGGPYTGEISASMLRDVGCSHVILGHSERRTLLGEESALVARKMVAALQEGLVPIVCIGETLQEREEERTLAVIRNQLTPLFPLLSPDAQDRPPLVIAYEPVWAIGTGRHASPDQIQEVHRFIRDELRDHLGATIASSMQILYGGSVTPANAATIFSQQDVDGGLIGGASLKAESFLAIADAC